MRSDLKCRLKLPAEESGYTIIETVVALAILITVLIPATATLSYFTTQRTSEHLLLGLTVGQRHMEETIAVADYSEHTVVDQEWTVRREIRHVDGLVMITIHVIRHRSGLPMISLTTGRTLP